MEMLTIPLSIAAFVATLWITSFFAKQLHAKNAGLEWVALSWLIAGIASVAMLVGIDILALDKYLEVAAMYFLPLVIFTVAYKAVNKMNWAAAVTTNVIAMTVATIAIVLTIVVSGKPLEKTLAGLASTAGLVDKVAVDSMDVSTLDREESDDDDIELVSITDADLLSPKVAAALESQKQKEKRSYKEPKFRLISVRNASGAVGYKIRLLQIMGKPTEVP
ncbi:MAG: hypothetical protein L3J47_08815 [Sulfurovum sp.]|nr:hypothetical protein [Sulfurovum sp.]